MEYFISIYPLVVGGIGIFLFFASLFVDLWFWLRKPVYLYTVYGNIIKTFLHINPFNGYYTYYRPYTKRDQIFLLQDNLVINCDGTDAIKWSFNVKDLHSTQL